MNRNVFLSLDGLAVASPSLSLYESITFEKVLY